MRPFAKVFKEDWKARLGFREVAQHSRCDTCSRLSRLRKAATSAAERAKYSTEYQEHLNLMFADRRLDARLTYLSELSCTSTVAFEGVLHVRIDGMDQSKFKVPRNLDDSKMWSKLWRPVLPMVGFRAEGVCSIFFVLEGDQKKDSNTELTCLSLGLQHTLSIISKRGLVRPEHLSVKYDNCAREGKNQHMLKYLSLLVHRNIFRSTQDGQAQVGHTHDRLDQEFSTIASVLSRAPRLETPMAFISSIQSGISSTARGSFDAWI